MVLLGGHDDVHRDGRCYGRCQRYERFANWLPATGWTFRGGDYAIAVHGAQFVVVESAKIESLDELAGLLRQLGS